MQSVPHRIGIKTLTILLCKTVRPYSIFPNFSFRIFVFLKPTCLCNYVSDRILPAATVRTIEWMVYLRSVIRPTHWVTSILNIGKKMKNLPLFCLYRLLKETGDSYRFNALIRHIYRFGRHDFPQDVHYFSDEILYNQLIHQCRLYKSNLFDAVKSMYIIAKKKGNEK